MESAIMRRLRYKRRRRFIETYEFPQALKRTLQEEFDGDLQVSIALEGLREWYLVCLRANGVALAMPSRAVDVAWHEMILMTRTYTAFCRDAFGYYLHHNPESVMEEPMRDGLARTLRMVDGGETVAGVPLLFAVDHQTGIEDGYVWGNEDLAGLRSNEPQRYAYHGAGAGCGSSAGCSSGSGCSGGGGGCSGGGCGGGGCGGGG